MPKYDVAVVGAGLGGLAAAALLTGKGRKVLLIDPAPEAGGTLAVHRKNGFRLQPGPSLSYGFEPGGVFRALYSELGIPQQATMVSPSYQVALPDRRVTVYADCEGTLEELRREFPGEIDRLVRFYRDIRRLAERCARSGLARALAARRSAAGFFGSYRLSRELAVFFDVQSLAFFDRPLSALSLAALVRLVETPPWQVQGGFSRVVEHLLAAFLKGGGEFASREPWPELLTAKSRVASVRLSKNPADAGSVLLNVAGAAGDATLFAGLRETVVPAGMIDRVLYLPDYTAPNSFLTVSLSERGDEGSAPKGMRTLTATRHSSGGGGSREDLPGLLEKLIPFLSGHIVFAEMQDVAGRTCTLPAGISLKASYAVRSDGQALLAPTTARNLYVIFDESGTPLQTVSAVRRLVSRLI